MLGLDPIYIAVVHNRTDTSFSARDLEIASDSLVSADNRSRFNTLLSLNVYINSILMIISLTLNNMICMINGQFNPLNIIVYSYN